ncbi:glutathione S-transferase [Sulfitobacter sp. HNIBRBA3233]|uniref:glutathione S-transferase family protein n=1 Tax=Sulfitobacter marinivivus TaxID=3158558 RepID=UPI0032DEDECB
MILYSCKTAPNPRRARMFLAEKGAEIEIREVEIAKGEQLSDAFLEVNPFGTVPALVTDGGTLITENVAIAHYLEEMFPDKPLMGQTPEERAEVLMWNAIAELHGLLPVGEAFRNSHPAMKDRAIPGPDNYAQIPELAERGHARALRFLDLLDGRLADREFICGDRFTLADITAFVGLSFARVIKMSVPSDKKAVADWFARVGERDSARA